MTYYYFYFFGREVSLRVGTSIDLSSAQHLPRRPATHVEASEIEPAREHSSVTFTATLHRDHVVTLNPTQCLQ